MTAEKKLKISNYARVEWKLGTKNTYGKNFRD
jgi:hypothetical protein